MSYPILYSATETKFDHNGIGILSDCVGYEVVIEGNGAYDFTMQYPMDGIHYSEIVDRAILKAAFDDEIAPQLFRIKTISKPMAGIVDIYAEHISYDLSGIPVSPFSATDIQGAFAGLKANAVIPCPFDFWTDKSTTAKFEVAQPASIRSRLGGVAGSILDVYGGEYEFDNFTVKLHRSLGRNRGVSVRYGKNLTDIKQEQNCANIATGIYPYWFGEVDGKPVVVELPEKIVRAEGTYNFEKILTVDFSVDFESQPSVESLRSRAQSYVKDNKIGVPDVSINVSFVSLSDYSENPAIQHLEKVALFDLVNVEFPELNVSSTAKVVRVVYDGLHKKIKSITLGNVRASISDTIANQQSAIAQAPTQSDVNRAQELATAWLTNGKGYKVERRDENGNVIDTLYMDVPNIATAKNVLRIGQSGIGFSNTGANGPYYSAWTIDGKFNADFISTGKLSSKDGELIFDLDKNTIQSGSSVNDYEIILENGAIRFRDRVHDVETIGIGRGFPGESYSSPWGGIVSFSTGKQIRAGGIGLYQGIPAIAALNEDGEVEWHTLMWVKDGVHIWLEAREGIPIYQNNN